MRITNQQLHEDLQDVKEDLRDIKVRLLDPDDGTIARVNKNTEFKQENQENLKDVDNLISWKSNVTKALWVVYSANTCGITTASQTSALVATTLPLGSIYSLLYTSTS